MYRKKITIPNLAITQNHCAYQVTLTQIFKNLTKILSLFGGKSYLIQTQNSDLAEIIKGKSFN